MMKRSILLSTVVICASTLMLGCKGKKAAIIEEQPAIIGVKTIPAEVITIDKVATFTSNIEAFQQNNISPAMPNRIEKILVDVGDKVRKGQLLVVMDQTEYLTSKIQVTQLKSDYDRMKSVYEAGGVTKQQLENAKNAYDVQMMALDLLSTNLELRSPIDGVVTARYFDPGDMFSASAGILQLMQINKLKVTIPVSELYFTKVKEGMSVNIAVDMYADEIFEGKVSLIYPAIDPATRTFNVEVTIPNGGMKLRPGMYSKSTLHLGQVDGVVVEDIAIQKQIGTNEKYVYIVENGVIKRTPVSVGEQVGNKVNIISGVNNGDQVVVAGMSKLSDGLEVEVKNN